jgi:hypothetical protein
MPQIPGVNGAAAPPVTKPATPVSQPKAVLKKKFLSPRMQLFGGIAGASVVVGVAVLWWVKSIPRKSAEYSDRESVSAESSAPVALPSAAAVSAQNEPGFVATVEELSKPWAAKSFTFQNPLTHEKVKAMAIRLPGGALWGFSLQVPYAQCDLEFVTDLDRLATQFGFRATHPMVVNPCNNTVYDPLKMGTLGENVWVRGEIVHGSDLRPPISIEIQTKGRSIIADRIE